MAMQKVDDCHACRQPAAEQFYDKLYKHSVCRSCYIERRRMAARALDSAWFLANIPFDQFTEEERLMTGIASLAEYELAKKPPEADGTESGESTREFRASKEFRG